MTVPNYPGELENLWIGYQIINHYESNIDQLEVGIWKIEIKHLQVIIWCIRIHKLLSFKKSCWHVGITLI